MSEKIREEHLSRAAYVYIRQSSSYQVRFHLEGQKRQYGLAERARQLGFHEVVVIDEDLGRSGSGQQERPGLLRQRARQAYLQKVHRGCALWQVAVGFVRTEEGQIEKNPDRQVQQVIEAVFEKFRQLGSARTMIWFREEQILLPAAKPGSEGREVLWHRATLSRVRQILKNPCYGGAFAFGRTGTKMSVVEGRAQKSPSRRYKSLEQWHVLILDHDCGYIGWQEYLKNRKLMAENLAQREGEGRGAVKKGAALLSGLLRCGRCGRKL
jgi:hypothetical protein